MKKNALKKKLTGAHYTPKILAEFVAEQITLAYSPIPKSEKVRILDPGVGDGELLLTLISRLFDIGYTNLEICGFDTDSYALKLASSRIKERFPQIDIALHSQDFTDFVLESYGIKGNRSLFTSAPPELFDLVIANPPYVRTQVMGAKKARWFRRQFGLSGRIDLYFVFIIGIACVLKPGGVAGVIVSNRFLTTKSGASIRKFLYEKFDILHVWDLGDTRLFEAAVLPAVILVERKKRRTQSLMAKFTSVYSINIDNPEHYCSNIIEALNFEGTVKVKDKNCYRVTHGILECDNNPEKVWRISNNSTDNWLNIVHNHVFCTFRDIGKIRVGVKTCADKVFIRADWEKLPVEERPEDELLKPVITHHIGQKFRSLQIEHTKKILYPHKVVDGRRVAIDLKNYPRAMKYLNKYRQILERRKYLIEADRQWFEIWVPQDPLAWKKPKIVFRDITEEPIFWMDLSESVVNGDCYWLTYDNPGKKELMWLALAIANSSFIKKYYDYRFHNKLYAGRRRFITQYVEEFPIPDPDERISLEIIEMTKEIYDLLPSLMAKELILELDQLVWKAFGLTVEEVSG